MLKSLYVSFYMMLAMAITVFAGIELRATQDYLAWGGVLLTTVPFLLVISYVMAFKSIARTSARFPTLIVMGLIGVIFATRGYVLSANTIAPVLAGIGFAGFLIYDYWYSSFDRGSDQLQVGQALPEFELTDTAGDTVTSASLSDKFESSGGILSSSSSSQIRQCRSLSSMSPGTIPKKSSPKSAMACSRVSNRNSDFWLSASGP